jgi:UDP-N-acetylmuramoylalanine--D-glutamate ligase
MDDTQFRGRNVLVMGLGVHGGGLGVVRWMAAQGANVRVTDLRDRERLREPIAALEAEGVPVEYTLGEHREEDFEWAGVVVKNPAVPNTSPWLEVARRLGKPIEMEMSIFLRLCPGRVVGITGTKGKSTTATWTWEMLRHWRPDALLAGNLRVSALEALPGITPQTPVVLELSSFQLEGLDEPRISPHIGAVTNLSPDHLDRYPGMEEYGEAKKPIFKYQQPGDWAVFNAGHRVVSSWAREAPAGVAWFGAGVEPRTPGVFVERGELVWHAPGGERMSLGPTSAIKVPGEHNLANAACAAACALLVGAPVEAVCAGLESFGGVRDRLEYLATIDGVRLYNDTTSTTPASTRVALRAVQGPVVLIAGGADKRLDFAELAPDVAQLAYEVVLLDGSATGLMERQFHEAGARIEGRYGDLRSAVEAALRAAPAGGAVLLSPGTASFGMFLNEFDRGDKFRAIVESLKGNDGS